MKLNIRSAATTLLILMIVIAAGLCAYNYAVNSPFRISSKEARRRINAKEVAAVLDVRTDLERETLGFYPNSVHIQSADLEREMPSRYPDKTTRFVVHCNTGHRARMATEKLQRMGYANAAYISGTHLSLM